MSPKKGVIPLQFLKHPPKSWREKKKRGNPKRSVKRTPKRKGGGKGKILGSVGLKGVLVGTVGMLGLRWLINRFLGGLGGYQDAVSMIGMGLVGKGIKQAGTAHLLPAGLELGASKLLESLTTGGRFGVTAQRGYDL